MCVRLAAAARPSGKLSELELWTRLFECVLSSQVPYYSAQIAAHRVTKIIFDSPTEDQVSLEKILAKHLNEPGLRSINVRAECPGVPRQLNPILQVVRRTSSCSKPGPELTPGSKSGGPDTCGHRPLTTLMVLLQCAKLNPSEERQSNGGRGGYDGACHVPERHGSASRASYPT